ncbi:MAG: endopeptidase La [Bacillota bacterium]
MGNELVLELREIPLLPLRGLLVFPNMVVHLDVGREKSVNAIEEAMNDNREIFLVMQKDAQIDEPDLEDVYQTGTIAEVKQLLKLPGGSIRVLVEGIARARIKNELTGNSIVKVEVEVFKEQVKKTLEVEALVRSLTDLFEQYVKLSRKIPPETVMAVVAIDEPGRLADIIASHLTLKLTDKQEILEAVDVETRLESLLRILVSEMEILELERKINIRVRRQMEKTQKEYHLREQLKAIHKELGEGDDRQSELDELKEKIEKAEFPKEVKEKALKELERLGKMPPMVAETAVVRNYLDWLLAVPWAQETVDRLDIIQAEAMLDEDHYGLQDVKDRILEYLAIRQLAKKMKGPILCFVGPPGVGKTSLGKSIARCLDRKFVRMSLGGMRDEAEIRGHRRTYVGALPGRIIQGMKTAGTRNPVILLDEIDKLGSDFRGDPSSALLEVLDPEQNNAFSDHYLEVPYDLSKVMFITTANVEHSIPRALLDRMEIIRISGYTEEEKLEIAKRHLIKKQIEEHGLSEERFSISDNALQKVIREYTREAGVRTLERQIATLCRKTARNVVAKKSEAGKITVQNLDQYLGMPRYRKRKAEKSDEIGVATGLAVTESGGDVLSIEATIFKGKGKITLTGQLGDVMKESAHAGLSFLRSRAEELKLPDGFHENLDIHIHVPEGAIPKDGPSAGITMATALTSALINRPIRKDVAMTGEVTLRGRILPIGGVKEKVLAAHRIGINTVILPKENEKDLEEVPVKIKKKMKLILAEHLDEVLDIALVGKVQ